MSVPNWFPLPINHPQTPKSIKILMIFGDKGYSICIRLLLKLASTETRTFPLAEIPVLAFEMRCETELLTNIINDYFENDGLIFWSDEVDESLKKYDDSFIKHSEAGKKSADQLTPEERREKGKKAGIASGKARKKG